MPYYDYDEYPFYEPSPYEEQISSLVDEIKANVKSEIVSELERLRKENKSLQAVKKRMKDIEQEHKQTLQELESIKRNALNEAKKMRLTELLKDYKAVIYTVDNIPICKPKCDKCDHNRQVPYTTPLGKAAKEDCTCKVTTFKHEIREVAATSIDHYSPEGDIRTNYYDDEREEKVLSYHMYKPNMKFQDVRKWFYFEDKKDAQAYCDWLNEQERIKEESK